MVVGVKQQDGENLSASNIEKVIALLEPEEGKPITKVVACEILNIKYNTARLNKIIKGHKDTAELQKTMRKKMRGQPIDNHTARQIVSSYMSGSSLADISDDTYRSTNVVKNVLRKYNVPIRNKSVDYFHPIFIENEDAICDDYEKGDLVYSARYDTPATIMSSQNTQKHGMVYKLQIHGNKRRQINQPYYELADLRKVQNELKVEMQDLDKATVNELIAEAMKKQKMQEDKRK